MARLLIAVIMLLISLIIAVWFARVLQDAGGGWWYALMIIPAFSIYSSIHAIILSVQIIQIERQIEEIRKWGRK